MTGAWRHSPGRYVRALLLACLPVLSVFSLPSSALAATPPLNRVEMAALERDGLRPETLHKALRAWREAAPAIRNRRFLTIIDFGLHSSKPRMFLVDTRTGRHQALLVAHGRGSDPDHDGWATRFSNVDGSKMSSLGAYVTGRIYFGKHGMSLRLDGLDPSNSHARERAIVIHGASYVSDDRRVLGRSWGCPAIAPKYVKRLLPQLAGGSFLYIGK